MAYVFLSYVHNVLGHPKEAEKCRQKAFELSQKMPEGDRYSIQGNYYLYKTQETWDKAIDAFNALLSIYPDNVDARFMLNSIYASLEEWEKATQSYEKIRHFRGYGGPPAIQLSVYRSQGLYDKATELLEFLLNTKEHPQYHHWLANTYLAQGKYDQALAEVDSALPFCQPTYPVFLYVNFLTRGDIQLCKGELSEAEDSYKKLLEIEPKPRRLYGFRGLASLYLLQGMFQKSKEVLRQGISLANELDEKAWASDINLKIAYLALQTGKSRQALQACEDALSLNVDNNNDIDRKIRIHHLKGLVLIESGRIKEAQGIADELKKIIESWLNPKLIRYHENLIGRINLDGGNAARAIEHLQAALSLVPYQTGSHSILIKEDQAMFIEPLAQAYFRSGDLQKAREAYEKITSLTSGRIHFGDICAKAHYMLGKVAEQQGQKAKAKEHYQKFLDLWKGADPGLPEPADAKKRLSSL